MVHYFPLLFVALVFIMALSMHILLYEYLHRQLAYFTQLFTVGFTSRLIIDDVTHYVQQLRTADWCNTNCRE